ncbi:hypothetical protein GCM10010345_59200 [Streptomyces canarius]|uniref:Uncharacterized protein n=1 Tax=Streptomyces canarius TaxID=285453 RepID=A0ABQ3D1Z4_9ACTN|nr:hypothetical protein GCM10010345_59200 [Streptomyces canarius]
MPPAVPGAAQAARDEYRTARYRSGGVGRAPAWPGTGGGFLSAARDQTQTTGTGMAGRLR